MHRFSASGAIGLHRLSTAGAIALRRFATSSAIALHRFTALGAIGLTAVWSGASQAAEPAAGETSSSWAGAGNALSGLVIVLIIILGAAWLLKRVQPGRFADHHLLHTRSSLSVGPRERVMVVEIGEQWLVLGVTAHSITTLHTLARAELSERPAAVAGAGIVAARTVFPPL